MAQYVLCLDLTWKLLPWAVESSSLGLHDSVPVLFARQRPDYVHGVRHEPAHGGDMSQWSLFWLLRSVLCSFPEIAHVFVYVAGHTRHVYLVSHGVVYDAFCRMLSWVRVMIKMYKRCMERLWTDFRYCSIDVGNADREIIEIVEMIEAGCCDGWGLLLTKKSFRIFGEKIGCSRSIERSWCRCIGGYGWRPATIKTLILYEELFMIFPTVSCYSLELW